MKWMSYFFGLAFIFLHFENLEAQQPRKPYITNAPEYLYVRVKQLYEFIDRFNYKNDIFGNPIDSVFAAKIPRDKYIESLFNNELIRNDNSFRQLSNEFIDDVVKGHKIINTESNQIYAHITAVFNPEKSSKSIQIRLRLEFDNGYCWMLFSADTGLINKSNRIPSNNYKYNTPIIGYISPVSNETNFIDLIKILQPGIKLADYSSSDGDLASIRRLEEYINQSGSGFDHCQELVYHIYCINGWDIEIRNFNRSTYNSGWLISDLKKI
jgi:hypothetical protein